MIAYCRQCQRNTVTAYLRLSSGHIGNCCSVCRATRKGRPFVSRSEYETEQPPMPLEAQGDTSYRTAYR